MIAQYAYIIALIACSVWFTMGFHYFYFKKEAASKLTVARSQRASPIFLSVIAGQRFLGGMNAAFALLSISLLAIALAGLPYFASSIERALLLIVLGAAHFSQFWGNVPIIRNGERQGDAYWPVLSGPMLMIFVVDAAEAALCFAVAAIILTV